MDIRHDPLTIVAEVSSIGLYRGATARLQNARGMQLHVETGRVWLTHDHRADDVILEAGETYAIEHDGMTVVSSLGRRFALVTVESASPAKPKPSFAERLGNFWCSLYVEPAFARRATT